VNGDPWVNQCLAYQDLVGPEPLTSGYSDLQRWEKWQAWFRRFCKLFPASNGIIREHGAVQYHPPLRSQVTTRVKAGWPPPEARVFRPGRHFRVRLALDYLRWPLQARRRRSLLSQALRRAT
jgi:hypothetical protein